MNGLEELRSSLTAYLNDCGIPAVNAWESGKRTRTEIPVVAVSLRGCAGTPAGLQDYLGESWEEERGCWVERYGSRVELTFGLDIWSPRSGGAAACAQRFSELTQVLMACAPAGVRLREISCGETVFDEEAGLFHCPVRAMGTVMLQAAREESGAWMDFTVKGTRR